MQKLDVIADDVLEKGHGAISVAWVNDGEGWFALILDKARKAPVAQGRSLDSATAALERAYGQIA